MTDTARLVSYFKRNCTGESWPCSSPNLRRPPIRAVDTSCATTGLKWAVVLVCCTAQRCKLLKEMNHFKAQSMKTYSGTPEMHLATEKEAQPSSHGKQEAYCLTPSIVLEKRWRSL